MQGRAGVNFGVGARIHADHATNAGPRAGVNVGNSSAAHPTDQRPSVDARPQTGTDADREAELIARAKLICGETHVITDPAVVEVYRRHGLSQMAPAPLVVVLPASGAEVAGLVGACSALSIGWTVRGAGTAPDGSALPRPGSALIVLTRMRQILTALSADGEITVEPGVSIERLRSAAGESMLPGASPSATVGGHIASVRGLRGVVGIEVVAPDGLLVRSPARQPGYDLAGAFCGSAGQVGIAVSLTLVKSEAS